MHANSVTVNFDFFLGGDALVDEEFENVTSVIALKLNDVTPLAVLCCVSIAAPSLLKVARQLSHVQVLRQSSNRGQTLTGISFLKVGVGRKSKTHLFIKYITNWMDII